MPRRPRTVSPDNPREHTDAEKRAIVERVCETMADGGLAKSELAEVGIKRSTLWRWTEGPDGDKELARMYLRARELQTHAMAEDVIDLSDKAIPGKNGNVDKVRLQCDSRKWLTSKIAPKLYGDLQRHEVTGRDGIPLIPPPSTRLDLGLLSMADLLQLERLTAQATIVVEAPDAGATPGAQGALGSGSTGSDATDNTHGDRGDDTHGR